jgi:hypothetical protein
MSNYQLSVLIKRALLILIFSGGVLLTRAVSCAEGLSFETDGVSQRLSAPVRYRPGQFPKRAGEYYRLIWGVDSLNVKAMESGKLIRFSYRVLDPEKAKPLNDKKLQPYLNSPARGIQLVIPSLEKVGQLRQAGESEPGRIYWMAFSNPHRTIRPGDHINIVIGDFHADGLLVE